MARYMWKNIEPALQRRVREAVERPELDVFRQEKYVGLHIRRGDKITEGEMEKVETQVRCRCFRYTCLRHGCLILRCGDA